MRRIFAIATMAAMLCVGLQGTVSAAAPTVNVSIGTASLGGNFFVMGAAIAEVLAAKLGYRAVAQATAGSAFNVDAVHTKELTTAISQATTVATAVRGEDQFEKPVSDVRTLYNWNATPVHILVKRSVAADNITGLTGLRFECMSPGDGIELTTKMMGEAFGFAGKIKMEHSGNRVQSASRFKTGSMDVVLDATGIGASWMSDIIGDGSNFKLLSLTEEQIKQIVTAFPEMSRMVIPANTYKGQTQDVVTVGNWTTLFAHQSMPDDVAYAITKSAFENKETLVRGHNFFKDLAPENVKTGNPAPLHPGAARYYKERGVL